ncbi:GNAT family N-acetyltransferase [Geofilum sp. OHC36d9]|uniref:GNAT family N-acetyltransferase n=1 Tax=Geofilum sp. OHC36d9 TaxID=3458413 RepID=UPI00403356D8
MPNQSVEIIKCNFKNPDHTTAFIDLLNEYMAHPMGDTTKLTQIQKETLIHELSIHPTAWVLLLKYDNKITGAATCFKNFSTFKAAPFINVHDLIISQHYRRKGLARKLLSGIITMAKEAQCCKVNLEVRADNEAAMALYRGIGFGECNPPMKFWQLPLD